MPTPGRQLKGGVPTVVPRCRRRRFLRDRERGIQERFTHLAFGILLGNLHGPGTRAGTALQDAPWARDRREYEPVVEHHVEDLVHILEAIDFVLLPRVGHQSDRH